MRTRHPTKTFAVLAAVCLFMASNAVLAFGLADIDQRAKALAAKDYVQPKNALPAALRELNYEQYRDIRFRPDKAFFANSGGPYRLQLFHVGHLYRRPVTIKLENAGDRLVRSKRRSA